MKDDGSVHVSLDFDKKKFISTCLWIWFIFTIVSLANFAYFGKGFWVSFPVDHSEKDRGFVLLLFNLCGIFFPPVYGAYLHDLKTENK